MSNPYQAYPSNPPTSGMAITSMVTGIVGWLLELIFICANLFFGTVSLGVLLLCTVPLLCIPPITWLIAVITGHIANSRINAGQATGSGMAIAGLVMGYIGVVTTLILFFLFLVLPALGFGLSLPIIDELMREFQIY